VARLLEGAPATATTKAAFGDPVVGAVLGRMDPQQAIVAGGGALPTDSNGYPWNGRYIVASGNLLAETAVVPNALFDEEYAEHATSVWHLSDGTRGQDGSLATAGAKTERGAASRART
jgi:Mn-containing catalase